MKQCFKVAVAVFCVSLMLTASSIASTGKEQSGKTPIVVASFGTTYPTALKSIGNILDHVKKAYPKTEVRLTFTSNIIRSVWKERQAEPQKWLGQGVPKEVLYVRNIIATVGDLVEDGYTNIIVQPTHMFFMEQSHDLMSHIRGLSSIHTIKRKWNPINRIVMARPVLGQPGDRYSYHDDVAYAVKTLAADVEKAKKEGAALVYMGHGNEHWSVGIYDTMQRVMRKTYPEVKTVIGVVEGDPTVEDVLRQLKHAGTDKVVLKPFMIVAGDHATNDMAGEEEDSWKSLLTKEGFQVETVLEGLGSNNEFADIFVKHIADAAKDARIKLQ